MAYVGMPYPPPMVASQQIPIEFPKWVTSPSGVPVLVNSAEEEAALIAPKSGREALIHEAEALGIKVDGRWAESRLRIEIDMAASGQKRS